VLLHVHKWQPQPEDSKSATRAVTVPVAELQLEVELESMVQSRCCQCSYRGVPIPTSSSSWSLGLARLGVVSIPWSVSPRCFFDLVVDLQSRRRCRTVSGTPSPTRGRRAPDTGRHHHDGGCKAVVPLSLHLQ
jgi:hypothetical protein